MKELKEGNQSTVFIIIMWMVPSGYIDTVLKPIKNSDISLFESKEIWAIHKAKKYTTIVYDKLGNSVWRYTHKGGPLYTNTWRDGVQKALSGIK
tara:strand:- start:627 stop:908 length:282 start_codon:yes stop_codon:yes gene_type:complete